MQQIELESEIDEKMNSIYGLEYNSNLPAREKKKRVDLEHPFNFCRRALPKEVAKSDGLAKKGYMNTPYFSQKNRNLSFTRQRFPEIELLDM